MLVPVTTTVSRLLPCACALAKEMAERAVPTMRRAIRALLPLTRRDFVAMDFPLRNADGVKSPPLMLYALLRIRCPSMTECQSKTRYTVRGVPECVKAAPFPHQNRQS